MSYEVLEKTYNTLTEEQQAIVYNLVLSLGNMNISIKESKPEMSKDEKLTLFNELNGCIKVTKNVDAREEYLEYLDERYGV
ncbi:MAG: hypothetical protein VZR24_19160 [Butyrivibrio hungatei]|nr:hypothetical protein [Butyrivibrio hungatei]